MLEGESASVEIRGEPKDRMALAAALRERRGWHARLPALAGAVVFALTVTFGRDLLAQSPTIAFPMAATLASIAGLLFFLVILNVLARARWKKSGDPRTAFLRGFKVTVGPEGVEIASDYFQARYLWPGILRLKETATHLFLYTDRTQAIIVPKRSFPSREEASRFAIIVRAHVGAG